MNSQERSKIKQRASSQLKLPIRKSSFVVSTDFKDIEAKRKKSFDESKTVKKYDRMTTKIENVQIEDKFNYKLSTQLLSFEMEQQRNHQLKMIKESPQLQSYYLAFKRLFMIIYQASHYILENTFKLSLLVFENKNVEVLCIFMQQQREHWTVQFLQQLKVVAQNIALLASNPFEYQKRIDMVARKVTLHNEKQPKIKNAFLNPRISKYWMEVQKYFPDDDVVDYICDQFAKSEQKLCFLQVKDFVNNKLKTQKFHRFIKKNCHLQEIDDDTNFDFKFEFILTEEFCFNYSPNFFKQQESKEQSNCSIY